MGQEVTVLQEVQGTLAKMSDQFKMALPRHITPEKFIRACQTAAQNNPDLLQCNRPSFYNACMKCASDGLIPDGREAAIVKFGSDAAYLPMVGGILKLIRNSGELKTIDADVVHEKDEYDSWVDETGAHFRHKKARGDRGMAILTYAYAVMKDGGLYFEEVSEAEMAGIQKVARSQNVWTGAFRDEMKKKSAIHRMAKRMPKSTDVEMVLKHDEELYDLEKPAEEKPEVTTSSKLAEAVTGSSRPPVEEAEIIKNDPPKAVEGSQPDAPVGAKELKAILFERITTKNAPPESGKKWVKYGGLYNGQWYGTFDSKFGDLIQYSIKNRALMNVTYAEVQKGDKTYQEITSIVQADLGDVQDEDIPI